VPARKVKDLELGNASEIQRIANSYLTYAGWYRD
jgi:hypothetical protein